MEDNLAKKIILLLLIVLAFLCSTHLFGQGRAAVHVKLDSDTRFGMPYNLRLQFEVESYDRRESVKIPFMTEPILGGAGLMVEHISPDGIITKQKRPKQFLHKWTSRYELEYIELKYLAEKQFLSPSFSVWVFFASLCIGPNTAFDMTKPGIYQISYEHPWSDPNNPNILDFYSERLTVIPVNWKRADQISGILRSDPKRELASYKFRNPELSENYDRTHWHPWLDPTLKAALINAPQDLTLYLLGSPDWISIKENSTQQDWHYTTHGNGGFLVRFNDGRVVSIIRS